MTTQKPRLALTVPPDLMEVLVALSEVHGKPVSKVVIELLGELKPQLEGIVKLAQVAKTGNKEAVKRALVHMVGDTMAELMTSQQAELDLARKGKKS